MFLTKLIYCHLELVQQYPILELDPLFQSVSHHREAWSYKTDNLQRVNEEVVAVPQLAGGIFKLMVSLLLEFYSSQALFFH